jgi:S-methylmethionine-dependent homocysteine/selenocysteine methylase
MTLTHVEEALGVARAARAVDLDVVISATVETNGRLPDGSSLGELIRSVDEATDAGPAFYMVNCAHPSHVLPALEEARRSDADWLTRFRGFRGNASAKSHAELDESPELDRGEPDGFAADVAAMQRRFELTLVGGCCGTDAEHVARLASRIAQGRREAPISARARATALRA